MTGEKNIPSLICQKENKQPQTQENPELSPKRQTHKELLDNAKKANDQKSNPEFIQTPLTPKEENKHTTSNLSSKLSSQRQTYKEKLENANGTRSISSFLYSHTTQKNQTEKNKSKMDNKNSIMTIKK